MKFGHDYIQILEQEGFPTQWVRSAISYRQLKKCIKKVRHELMELGLSRDILNQLWQPDGEADRRVVEDVVPSAAGFNYSFCTASDASAFVPKLTLILDPKDGSPIDAYLSPETRKYLEGLSQHSWPPIDSGVRASEGGTKSQSVVSRDRAIQAHAMRQTPPAVQTIEIPLSSDYEFFRILRGSLTALHDLQKQEQQALDRQVRTLRREIVKVANSPFSRTQHKLYAWREIFRLYIEMQIFFSTNERAGGQRTAEAASEQLQKFQSTLAKDTRIRKLKRDSRVALENFLSINADLLQNLKFQELNRIALTKILKKFDKQTALRARAALPCFASTDPFLAQGVAKAICQSISDELLTVVPQIDDYLCPICLNVAFKPVRLQCKHVFCIRCLVIMQRDRKKQCPLCRQEVVLQATSDNLDRKLLSFLSATFPKETRAKQKENERAASLDLYGETYGVCSVM